MECKPREARTRRWKRGFLFFAVLAASLFGLATPAFAAEGGGGEASLVLPDLNSVKFHGAPGGDLLAFGLIICALGLVFGLVVFFGLRSLPVHRSMREISELIWQTCKTYLLKQGLFLALLWVFIAIVIFVYFGFLSTVEGGNTPLRVFIIILFSILGILGSYGVAWFGIRVNNYANSRTAFASLRGKPYGIHSIPMRAGMSVGMMLISVELIIMLIILIWIPRSYAGPCFIGFAIGESLGAAALRIAGGIFTKIADIGSDLMKIVFNIKEDDARNPGVIADCTGDNAGDSVGPSADGFETYGVTGVALITFIILAVQEPMFQVALLVWIFAMRVVMIISSGGSYFLNAAIAKSRYGKADKMNFETPLTSLVWITSIVSMILTFVVSYVLIGGSTDVGQAHPNYWWLLSIIISMGTVAGALIPELVKVFTSTKSAHVKEVVKSAREGGASLDILSGFVSGNFSAYYIGFTIMVLMGIGYLVSTVGFDINGGGIMLAPAVFAFGLVAFGFLGMGPVTIAVDSYGPVTDNAQSVYELSTIEQIPNISEEIKGEFGFDPAWDVAKDNLEENDGAGNTFKATAKPVLIGTAVVGATTMIFSIIMALTDELTANVDKLSLLYPPFVLGLIMGGAMIYWFTGAATQAVTTGAYRAVEFIKGHIKLDTAEAKANVEDSKAVVGICTTYAQQGMINIFFAVFFGTLAFAFLEPFFFIGYLISIAVFGLFQAIFMANAGGAWDNAKKIVETDLKEKGTELHAATVVGDTVGDPFKDTSSVAMNPVIKFTTLFGLLAAELGVTIANSQGNRVLNYVLAAVFFLISVFFVWRSFFRMRIRNEEV